MNNKNEILQRIRTRAVPPAPLPELSGPWIEYPDRQQQFCEALASVGGRAVPVSNLDELNAELEKISAYATAKVMYSHCPGVGRSTVDPAAVAAPHELANLDFAIFPGAFGVAENGAVWVTDRGLPHRVSFFITQHLALVIPAAEIVNNLSEAYTRLDWQNPGFGTFISGPSKTADIEQSLVIGAHGARSLHVFLLNTAN